MSDIMASRNHDLSSWDNLYNATLIGAACISKLLPEFPLDMKIY